MRGRKLTIVIALLLALAAATAPNAKAQGGLTYTSGIQVQNLSDSEAAIQIQFYDENTGAVVGGATVNTTLPARGQVTYYPLDTVPTGFKGSAVITSNQEIAAITNLLGNGGAYAGSATGLTAASPNIGLPLIMRNNGGFSTFFSVQNAGTEATNVTVTYTRGLAGTNFTTAPVTIQPGASRTFDQFATSELGDRFVGSARITSNNNQPLAATVSQIGLGGSRAMLMYNGFSGGSTNIRAPLIAANNSGFFTGLSIQNVGNAATTVTITYGANTAGGFAPTSETLELAAGQSGVTIQAGDKWTVSNVPQRYVGSATITASQPLVAVVNQLQAGSMLGTAYEGINPTAGITQRVSLPLIMSNNSGYFTGVQCQNLGNANANITITYSGPGAPAADVVSNVAPGNSATVLQNTAKFGSARFVGSATVTANQNIACLVNQVALGTAGDSFLTYNGINY
jgi:hypothetical protein